jgi:hypothetical protein
MKAAPWAIVAIAVCLGGSASSQEGPLLSLRCQPPSARARDPRLGLEGSASLPDSVVLKISIHTVGEAVAGKGLKTFSVGVGGGLAEMKGKKFGYEPVVPGAGQYVIVVDLMDEYQKPAVRDSLKQVKQRRWTFEFSAWSDDLAAQWDARLQDLDRLSADTASFVKRYGDACASEAAWNAVSKELLKESSQLLAKLQTTPAKAVFPAAHSQIMLTVQQLQSCMGLLSWKDGKFKGATSYHSKDEPCKTFRGEEFRFEHYKRYLEEANEIAGRELALWAIKDMRRAQGKRSAQLENALRASAAHVGFSGFVERLQAATPEDLADLEKAVRIAAPTPKAQ